MWASDELWMRYTSKLSPGLEKKETISQAVPVPIVQNCSVFSSVFVAEPVLNESLIQLPSLLLPNQVRRLTDARWLWQTFLTKQEKVFRLCLTKKTAPDSWDGSCVMLLIILYRRTRILVVWLVIFCHIFWASQAVKTWAPKMDDTFVWSPSE